MARHSVSPRYRSRAAAAVFALCVAAGRGAAEPPALVVQPDQTVVLQPGSYHYASVTIHPRGLLRFGGRVTLNVTGDVRLLAQEVPYPDPDTGEIVTRLEVGILQGHVSRIGTNGAEGTAGMNGSPGYFTGDPGTIFNLQTASSGDWGGNGAAALTGQFALDAVELTINAGHDILIDGHTSLLAGFHGSSIGGRGGNGGQGGHGGLGLSHYGAPIQPGSDVPLAREYANGGWGGRGGHGGSGARVGPTPASRLVLNAGHRLVLGPTGILSTRSGSDGGWGGGGGQGGDGGSGGQASLTSPLLFGDCGPGGKGGNGGQGAGAGNGGDISVQAPSITLSGFIEQQGARGGDGGVGGRAGAPGALGATACRSDGGDGGDGGPGGWGGNLRLRGAEVINNATGAREGGFGGWGERGGFPWSFLHGEQGAFGTDGAAGISGAVITAEVASSALGNGSFDDGLAFFAQSGEGSASVVSLAENAVLEMLTTETAPVDLMQLVSTAAQPMLLQLDYRFLSPTGSLRVLLGSVELLAITPTAVDSGFGVPDVTPSPVDGFARVSLVLGDAALLGHSATELHLRLMPGSIARAQVDNLVFAPVQPPPDDLDGDGFTTAQGDCNDAHAAIHPGATELPNQVDDDCDGTVDEGLGLDTTAPTTTVVGSPVANGQGWNDGNVTVTLSASDNAGGSGVEEIRYTLAGAQSGDGAVAGASAELVLSAEGITIVTFFARDSAGNEEAARTLQVSIDKTAPVLSCSASPNRLRPRGHRLVAVSVTVTVADSLSGASSFALVSATSNQSDNGPGDGNTSDDIQDFAPGTADTSGLLRAEASRIVGGRVYSLSYQAADAAGNTGTCTATVSVGRR